jgi:hypothetical protein
MIILVIPRYGLNDRTPIIGNHKVIDRGRAASILCRVEEA